MSNVLGSLFQDIADAIRTKTGGTDTMKPAEFPTQIANIPVGGGSSADVRYVTFVGADGATLIVKPVAVGDDCVDVAAKGLISTPIKESTAQYDYTYSGWSLTSGGAASSAALQSVTEDRTVYAAFTASARLYWARFYDGDTLMQESQVAYGTKATPPDTDKAGYAFNGWTPSDLTIYGDTNFVGAWSKAKYTLIDNPSDLPTSVRRIEYHPNGTYCDVFSISSNTLTISTYDNTVTPMSKLFETTMSFRGLNHIAYHPDNGKHLAVMGYDSSKKGVNIYDTTTTPYTWVQTIWLSGHYSKDNVMMYYSADGTALIVECNYTVETYDATGTTYTKIDNSFVTSTLYLYTGFCYNSDRTLLALWNNIKDGGYTYQIYDTTKTPYVKKGGSSSSYPITSVAFVPNPNSDIPRFAVAGQNLTSSYPYLMIADLDGGSAAGFSVINALPAAPPSANGRLASSNNGNKLVWINGTQMRIYDVSTTPFTLLDDYVDILPSATSTLYATYNPSGARLAVGSTTPYFYNTECDLA